MHSIPTITSRLLCGLVMYAALAPLCATSLWRPWGLQNGQRQGMTPHELRPLVSMHLRHLYLHLRLGWGCCGCTYCIAAKVWPIAWTAWVCIRNICSIDIGGGVATATELPPPRVPTSPAEHPFHLCACSQTSVESTHTSDLDSAVFHHKKRYIEIFIALNK